jgi:thiol-disulfide isomerase/thioredoxin
VPFWKSVVPHDREIRRGERKFAIGDRSFNGYEQNKIWRGNGDGTFEEVGWAAGGDLIVDSRACAAADFDRDGRVDLAVRTMHERSYFYRNEGEAGRFLHVRLVGTRSNRMGVGARVTARWGSELRTAELACGSGYLSQSEPAVRFGLGARERVERLEIRWPSGTVQEFRDVPADRFLTITEGRAEIRVEEPRPSEGPVRTAEDAVLAALRRGKFTDLEGRPVSPAGLLKDVTLLHVWNPSCKGCEKDAATLQEIATKAAVVAVAVESKPEDVRAFVERRRVTYPVILADEESSRAFRAAPRAGVRAQFGGWFELGSGEEGGLPWTGLLDRSGLQRVYRGPVKRFEAMLDLLSSRP